MFFSICNLGIDGRPRFRTDLETVVPITVTNIFQIIINGSPAVSKQFIRWLVEILTVRSRPGPGDYISLLRILVELAVDNYIVDVETIRQISNSYGRSCWFFQV